MMRQLQAPQGRQSTARLSGPRQGLSLRHSRQRLQCHAALPSSQNKMTLPIFPLRLVALPSATVGGHATHPRQMCGPVAAPPRAAVLLLLRVALYYYIRLGKVADGKYLSVHLKALPYPAALRSATFGPTGPCARV